MKRFINLIALVFLLPLSLLGADSAVSSLTGMTGLDVDRDNDLLYIVDTSAGASGSKKITVANLWQNDNFDSFSRIAAQLGGVKFDGGTSSQRATAFMGDSVAFGTNDFSVSVLLRIPSSTLAGNVSILGIDTSTTGSTAPPLSFAITLLTTDALRVRLYGASTGYYYHEYASFRSTYSGKVVLLTITRSAGTVTTYVNTASVSATSSTNTGSSPPASFAETVAGSYVHIGIGPTGATAGYNDRIIRAALFNCALSASEVATLYNDGILADQRWVSYHGGNAVLNIERNSAFSGTTDWTEDGTASISDSGAVVFTDADQWVGLASTYIAQLTPGVNHKITFDVSSGTYGGNSANVYLSPTPNASTFFGSAIATITADGSYNAEFTPPVGVTALSIVSVGGALNFTIDNVRVTKVLLTNGSFETRSGDDFGSWTETASGSTITADTSTVHGGSVSAKLTYATGGTATLIQSSGSMAVGKKYQVSAWFRHDKGSALTGIVYYGDQSSAATILTSDNSGSISIADSTWTKLTWNFTAARTTFGFGGYSAVGNTKSIWIDDVELIELGALDAWGPAGLDDFTTLWRSDNISSGRDATLFNLTQRADGSYQNIIMGYGRGSGERGRLGSISRESGTMSLGGISLAGTSGQRLTTIGASGSPSIGTNAVWVRWQGVVPTSSPSATQGGMWTMTSDSSAADAANTFKQHIGTSGQLVVTLFGSSTSNYRTATVNNFVSMFGGRTVDVVTGRDYTGKLAIWVNASPTAYVEAVSGTPPTWAGSITSTYSYAGVANTTVRWVGELNRFQLGRGFPTDSHVRQVYNSGLGTGAAVSGSTPFSRGGVINTTDGTLLVANLAVGNGFEYPDESGNGYHLLSAVRDETHKIQKNPFQIRGQTSTSGNQQLLGATCVSTNAYIESIVITSPHSGTPTVSLGTSSGTSNILAAASIVTGKNAVNVASLQTRFSSTGNLWVNSSTTNVLNWTITLSNSD